MADEMIFDYFYGQEADMFSFYRIPRIIIKDAHFAGLSSDAKILYGLALDRMSMSVKNGWQDENDRTFTFYTVENVMEDLNCSRKKAISFRKELEDFGLIERIRRGQGKPDLIYVKNFLGIHRVKNEDDFDSEMDNKAKKTDKKSASNPHKHSEVPKLHFKKCQNDTSRDVETAPQEVSETHFKKCQNDTSRSTESAPQEVPEMHPNYNNNNYSYREITKYLLSDSDTDKDYYYNATIPSEIADVGLVIKQVMYLMDNESYVAKTEEYKVKRQLGRMKDNTISEIVKKCKGKCSECEVAEECRKARGEDE